MSDVAMKTWTKSTLHFNAVSMSFGSALANPHISLFNPACAISFTASASPLDVIGNPASIVSTPSLSNWIAIFNLSSGVRLTPGVCSPSLSVVSNILINLLSLPISFSSFNSC